MKYGQCGNCVFWRGQYDQARRPLDWEHSGHCHAHAPIIYPAQNTDGHKTEWPDTQASHGCGDFQLAPEALSHKAW